MPMMMVSAMTNPLLFMAIGNVEGENLKQSFPSMTQNSTASLFPRVIPRFPSRTQNSTASPISQGDVVADVERATELRLPDL